MQGEIQPTGDETEARWDWATKVVDAVDFNSNAFIQLLYLLFDKETRL